MRNSQAFKAHSPSALRSRGQDISQPLALVVTVLAVIAAGALISAALPAGASLWYVISSYMAPASVAFVAYWWKAQDV